MLIQTNQLNFSFGRRAVLHDISLRVPEKCIYGFLGPNGAGKTTTIKCLLGLYQVTQGKVQIFGKELNKNRLEILSRTGNMVEEPSLYGHLSAWDNLDIARRLRGTPVHRIDETLHLVGLSQDSHRPARQFSSGMKQRLALGIALLSEPELLILDEPINGLDPGGIQEIRNLLQHLHQDMGVTIFISSHILSEIEKLCSHVAVIHKGKLIFQGEMEALLASKQGEMPVFVETGDPVKTLEILQNHFKVSQSDDGIKLFIEEKQDTARAIEMLVEHHIPVFQVKKEIHDLETSFLELIKE
ncbi:MAG: ATP-binding cassette domain-containing protein [Bacteroidetes bacterium]|nr:ATP-binding cassette domain-containing protein [Bacteroidota bacterium]